MEKPLSIVVFSKDRAAQLDLCLKSIYKNMNSLFKSFKVYVIYTSSSEEFENAYKKLPGEWYSRAPWMCFMPEKKYGGFKNTLESCMKRWEQHVLFFTDDDIVYRKFEHKYEEIANDKLFCISFRLGVNTFVQDQYTNSNCLIPDEVITGDELIRPWNWKSQRKDTNFAYPFSVDGHMFTSDLAKKIINNTPKYYNPNSLEGKAQHYIQEDVQSLPDEMACFEKSFVINTPLNRVQETCHNGAGKFFGSTPEELNKRFIAGDRLTLEGMDFSTIIGVHQELKLCWEK